MTEIQVLQVLKGPEGVAGHLLEDGNYQEEASFTLNKLPLRLREVRLVRLTSCGEGRRGRRLCARSREVREERGAREEGRMWEREQEERLSEVREERGENTWSSRLT